MFYTIGNKRFMGIDNARAYAFRYTKRTGKPVDITKITAKGISTDGKSAMIEGKIYYISGKGTYVLYSDGSTKVR